MGERLLQHVEIWENGSWTHIEPEEYQRNYLKPERRSKRLFCALCNQSVNFSTNGQTPYFKHSMETDYCPEKSLSNGARFDGFFKADDRELPIRLAHVDKDSVRFELGFFQLPRDIIEKNTGKKFALVKLPDNERLGEWKFERLQEKEKGTTYFPIGEISDGNDQNQNAPAKEYRLNVEDDRIKKYWGSKVPGLDFSKFVWFDAKSKKKLPRDADLCVGAKYCLFSKQYAWELLASGGWNIKASISAEHTYRTNTGTIFLLSVSVDAIDERTANFFRLTFGRRLTQNPVKLIPLQPPSVRDQYVVKIDRKSPFAYFYFRGSGCVTAKTYPFGFSNTVENDRGGLLRINSGAVQKTELISMGRTSVLQYALLWRESSKFLASVPTVEIVDADDENVRFESRECSCLPKKQRLLLKHPFDGYCEIFQNERLTEKRKLASDGKTEVVVQWGTTLKIYQGKDFIREIVFERRSTKLKTLDELPSDRLLLERLKRQRGRSEPISPAFASIATRMRGYPLTKAWLRDALLKGEAPRAALEILKKTFVR